MSPITELAEAVVEFAAGFEANWNNFALPIPSNVVIFTTDTKKFKRGDGEHRFSDLPDGPSISGIATGGDELLNVLTTLLPTDNDSIIIIDSELYKPSTTKLSDILARISAIANQDAIQDANMDTVVSQGSLVDSAAVAGSQDGILAVIKNHKIAPGVMPEGLIVSQDEPPVYIESFGIFSDKACTIPTDTFNYSSTYYAKIVGQHDVVDVDDLSFTLEETNAFIETIHLGRGLFKITVGKPNTGGPLVLTARVAYNTDDVVVNRTVTLNPFIPMISSIYGGASTDYFNAVTTDSQNNIICAGYTISEGVGGDALVVKFDINFNILARKRYGGTTNVDFFNAVATDSSDNIICAGQTQSEGAGNYDALVVKFDSNLNIWTRKIYGGTGNDYFFAVATDGSDNIICAGHTTSEGASGDALVIKFDGSLNIVARKRYGGGNSDTFRAVATDNSGNIICAGYTQSEGAGSVDALVVKFDSLLNIVARKRYGGAGADYFYAVATDSSDNIICVGYTASEGTGGDDALVVKFDSNLNIIARKFYWGSGGDRFDSVIIDGQDNIICVGYTSSEGAGGDALVVKFDNDLNIVAHKHYGGSSSSEHFYGVATDNSDNIICAGFTDSEGAGGGDGVVVRLPFDIPSGTITGTVLTGLILADSTMGLTVSALILADSTLILADSALTLADSALTLADSTLTYEKDVIEY